MPPKWATTWTTSTTDNKFLNENKLYHAKNSFASTLIFGQNKECYAKQNNVNSEKKLTRFEWAWVADEGCMDAPGTEAGGRAIPNTPDWTTGVTVDCNKLFTTDETEHEPPANVEVGQSLNSCEDGGSI